MSTIKTIAEIETDNERLANLEATRFKKEERYNHTILEDEGFILNQDTAVNLIKAYSPDKLAVKCARYYFIHDKYSAAVVGVDDKNIGLFTLEIPKELETYVADPINMDAALSYYDKEIEKYNKVKYVGYLVLLLISLVVVSALILAFSFNTTTALLMALLGFGFISVIIIGGI